MALASPGSKQPQKTNNYIQGTLYMHQNAPRGGGGVNRVPARYRANQYFSSTAVIVHAGHEETNEAELQRQRPRQRSFSTKGQKYLSDPRISCDLPRRSRH